MNLKAKLVGNEEERAVSPVIGVILMVAITVILAAVIAAFVLDMGQGQNSPVNAAVSVDEGSSETTVQLTDAGNSDTVYVKGSNLDFSSDDSCSSGTTSSTTGGSGTSHERCDLDSVGDTATINVDEEATVIGVKGGEETVLQNIN